MACSRMSLTSVVVYCCREPTVRIFQENIRTVESYVEQNACAIRGRLISRKERERFAVFKSGALVATFVEVHVIFGIS